MDYYRIGQKKAFLNLGLEKHANAIVPVQAMARGGRTIARPGMISTPAIGGGLIGAGLGAANAGEGNRLQGAALGGLLGTAGGTLGGLAGLRHGDKKFLRAIEESPNATQQMQDALHYFTGAADDAAAPAGNKILEAIQRTPEYTALGATTGAGAGAYLGGKAGAGLEEKPEPPPLPQLDPYLAYLLMQSQGMV